LLVIGIDELRSYTIETAVVGADSLTCQNPLAATPLESGLRRAELKEAAKSLLPTAMLTVSKPLFAVICTMSAAPGTSAELDETVAVGPSPAGGSEPFCWEAVCPAVVETPLMNCEIVEPLVTVLGPVGELEPLDPQESEISRTASPQPRRRRWSMAEYAAASSTVVGAFYTAGEVPTRRHFCRGAAA